MGVTGLWTVLKPCARPIKLETLNKKRLAIDASIWIYQFLKAVRDKEGNALRNAHVVGFFRRICKLLYYGIKPVFVFDGGAPALKRQTISSRKNRREGRREDAARTAGKLLAIQMQKLAEEENAKKIDNHRDEEEESIPQDVVYTDELFMSEQERNKNRQFRKKDAYHLPDMDMSFEAMGAPDDPRIMSQEELEEYARQFESGEDINIYDFSKIDFDSPFFLSLPASDRYNILNAARLRSRLRMGYSKEQLDTMFPDRMAFSKFQIDRVAERNDLTQRLMNINGMNGEDGFYGSTSGARIAGERDKEYVLVKDNGVEGGWALGVLGNKGEGNEDKPIDIEKYGKQIPSDDEEWEDEGEGFEDVPIEGLNRLPKLPMLEKGVFDESIRQDALEAARKRQAFYDSRKQAASRPLGTGGVEQELEEDTLFVPDEAEGHVPGVDDLFEEYAEGAGAEDEDLERAIQMSLESPAENNKEPGTSITQAGSESGFVNRTKNIEQEQDSDDDMDLFAALTKSKVTKQPTERQQPLPAQGPLPFEPLRVIRNPKQDNTDDKAPAAGTAGGFETSESKKQKESQPLPPWFSGKSGKGDFIQDNDGDQYSGLDYEHDARILANSKPVEVIDVDDDVQSANGVIDLEASTRQQPDSPTAMPKADVSQSANDTMVSNQQSGMAADSTNKIITSEDREILHIPTSDQNSSSQVQQASPSARATSLTPEFEDVELNKYTEKTEAPPANDAEVNNDALPERADHTMNVFHEYSDAEEEELVHQLTAEAEEHARFASTLNSKSQAENAFDYEQELKQLRSQQKKDRRDADEVSQVMITECQQLLQLFGLPYVTAPMEAEAQCAELVSLGLVDGIVTDDSDIFLFGGTRVYKNMFNQAKYVECYLTKDLEKEYALDRKKLISFAHLLGSDYTEGVHGIGPVTALEILTEFSGLEEFRDWWSRVQLAANIPDDPHAAFRKKFKKNIAKLFLPPNFPDARVEGAYMEPEVDPDPSDFQWGVPDLDAVRQFLMSTVGWSKERTDEVLVPVIRDANRRDLEGTQANITGFFQGPQGAGVFAPRRRTDGKSRMEKAFGRLRREAEARQGGDTANPNHPDASELPDANTSTPETSRRRTRSASDAEDVPENHNTRRSGRPARKARKKNTRPTTDNESNI